MSNKKQQHRDLLKELYDKNITEDQAYSIFSDIVDRCHNDPVSPYDLVMLDKYEATAKGSCSLSLVAKWRYEGWPKQCPKCKKKIIKKLWGLHCEEINGEEKLTHVSCSKKYLKSIGYTKEDLK